MKKQTAGRDNLGEFAPKFAELNAFIMLRNFGTILNLRWMMIILSAYVLIVITNGTGAIQKYF